MKKWILILICILATLLCAAALADVDIDSTFSDPNFREYIQSEFDQDGDGKLTEEDIKGITKIDCYGKSIEDLKGIECFYNMASLDCSNNLLTKLDTSHNAALDHLYCSDNKLTELDLSKNIKLEYLSCYRNKLLSINVSSNTALETLHCYDNKLTKLDVTKNTRLETLSCDRNKLTTLDITNNTVLDDLSCDDNQLIHLDVSKSTLLSSLDCSSNKLTQIDVSQNTMLEWLECDNNNLSSINVNNNPFLERLDCSNNHITSLDLHSTTLKTLNCYENAIEQLDLSDCSILSAIVRNNERDRSGSYDVFGDAVRVDHMTTVIAGDFTSDGVTKKQVSITLSKTKLTFKDGRTQTVTATLGNPYDSISTEYSSSWDNKIAKVKIKGNEIQITPGKKTGQTSIYIATEQGATAYIDVTVKSGAALNEKSITLKPKKTFKIKVLSIPATVKAKSFTSSKPTVATVDKKGKVKALKKGSATITVTLTNGKKLKLKVKVK